MIKDIYSEDPVCEAGRYIAKVLKEHLEAGEQVSWLLSGGSGVHVAIEALRRLQGTNLAKLYVTLTDERFGPIGHPNENWQQLLDNGMDLEGATTYRPLTNEEPEVTREAFGAELESHITGADYSLGIFGVGPDGHTAGIKPHSPATLEVQAWASMYEAEDFERLTMTFPAIQALDEVVIQASGLAKTAILEDILNHTHTRADQPAQVLKIVPRATLFTDTHLTHIKGE